MAEKARSFEFCGRKIVPWGYRPRRAVKVHRGFYLVALCPMGVVALDGDQIFKKRGNLAAVEQRRLAADLFEIGAISRRQRDAATKIAHAAENIKRRKEAAAEIADHATTLGIKFTKHQRQQIGKAS